MPSSLVTINNNVSLISINVAPGTWLATVVVFFVLVALYMPQVSFRIPLPRFSNLSPVIRSLQQRGPSRIDDSQALPLKAQSQQVILRDQALVVARHSAVGGVVDSRKHNGRPSGRPRRLLAGLRTTRQPGVDAPLASAAKRTGHGGSRGFRHRFGRWLLAASLAETRRRQPEQRLLEAPATAAALC